MLDRKPKTLSGGQRQRVAVGRAIVRDPKCFLFDEPLSNLDAKLRVEMRAEIKRIHMGLKSTTIYVTHDQEEAMTLGDRVVVMKDGIIQQCGAPLEVYHRPVNRFVAGFVGMPPMNFFEGAIVERGRQALVRRGDGELAVPDLGQRMRSPPRSAPSVVMGIRPQAISDRPHAARGRKTTSRDEGRRDRVLGRQDGCVHLHDRHSHVIAHIDAHRGLIPNETRAMYFDLNRMHFFETGELGVRLATAPSLQKLRSRRRALRCPFAQRVQCGS